MVRVYELRSAAAFDNADFFTLQNEDRKVLAADLLGRRRVHHAAGHR